MRPALAILLVLAAAGGVAFVVMRRRASVPDAGGAGASLWLPLDLPSLDFGTWGSEASAEGESVWDEVMNAAYAAVGSWRDPPLEYASLIAQAEDSNGMPRNLLARQLWQESRYNPAAVNARTGAQGIAQVMPATARNPGFGVPPLANPFDAPSAIAWAGRYMRAMRDYTGSWTLALAAYNWGPGNATKKPPSAWPSETVEYVASIAADVGLA